MFTLTVTTRSDGNPVQFNVWGPAAGVTSPGPYPNCEDADAAKAKVDAVGAPKNWVATITP